MSAAPLACRAEESHPPLSPSADPTPKAYVLFRLEIFRHAALRSATLAI
jgi:hypothetical protein